MNAIYKYLLLKNFFSGAAFFLGTALLLSPVQAQGAVFMQSGTSTSKSTQGGTPPPTRQDSFMGTGNSATGGFSSTYTDPQSGDVITRVIPPEQQNTQQTPVPIYIYPQVEPQWPPMNNIQPRPVPQPRAVPEPHAPKQPANPSLYSPYGR